MAEINWKDAQAWAVVSVDFRDPLGNAARAFLALDALVGEMAEHFKDAVSPGHPLGAREWVTKRDALIARAEETRGG